MLPLRRRLRLLACILLLGYIVDGFRLQAKAINFGRFMQFSAQSVGLRKQSQQRSNSPVVLRANPRRIEFGEGSSNSHGKDMLKHTLLTAKDEFDLGRAYKVGTEIEAQYRMLSEQLGRPVSDADVAQSLDIEPSQVRALLDRMEHAKSALTAANMRLVFHIARYYKFRGVAYPDLVQEGTFGLIKAIQKFDPDRGFRFSTYASWWIKQSISRAVAEKSRLIRLPVHVHDLMVSISKVEREFIVEFGRKPSPQEVAERLALPLHKVEMLMRASQDITSIDEAAFQNRAKAETSAVTVKEKIASTSNPEPAALSTKNSLRAELRRAMSILNEREAQVLELRFGLAGELPMTLEDIGKKFKVTRERIRQIEARALAKMRNPAKKTELEEIFSEHTGGVSMRPAVPDEVPKYAGLSGGGGGGGDGGHGSSGGGGSGITTAAALGARGKARAAAVLGALER